jgi:hypothetical protein
MNKIKFNFSLIFDLVKSCDLMIPFITRSTILSEEDASTLNHPDIVGMLTIDEFYGFTGLHAIKRAVVAISKTNKPIRIVSVDRYFLGKGFKPQYIFGSGMSNEKDKSAGKHLSILILDENKNLTPNIPIDRAKIYWK